MKKLIILSAVILFTFHSFSQDMKAFKLYKPEENAEQKISEAIVLAKKEGKHVFLQIGGNWCIWCARFNDFVTKDKSIDSLINENYVEYHLNYSKENKNEKVLAKYGFPQRFGFPVFLILDGNGKLIHTQNSSYLEEASGYSENAVKGFFSDWTPKALDPNLYKEK